MDVLVSCDGLRKVEKNLNNVFEALFSAAQQPGLQYFLERPNDCDKLYMVRPILDCIRARCHQG
jgi:hypothetical protein